MKLSDKAEEILEALWIAVEEKGQGYAELEKIKAQQRGELKEYPEATTLGGGGVSATRWGVEGEEGKSPSARRFYGIVQSFNEMIKNWKGT